MSFRQSIHYSHFMVKWLNTSWLISIVGVHGERNREDFFFKLKSTQYPANNLLTLVWSICVPELPYFSHLNDITFAIVNLEKQIRGILNQNWAPHSSVILWWQARTWVPSSYSWIFRITPLGWRLMPPLICIPTKLWCSLGAPAQSITQTQPFNLSAALSFVTGAKVVRKWPVDRVTLPLGELWEESRTWI